MFNGILLDYKKRLNTPTWYKVDGPGGFHAEPNNSDRKS